jgi:cytochrome c oxidase assembly protein subunit 15
METNMRTGNGNRAIAIWLYTGVGMIMVQVLLGGITRLTGSGLSITEWKPLLGALPPMNEADWLAAFDQYKQIGQFKHINFDFTLSDFKFIYFWEWFHRVWARLIGLVFLFPFLWFLWKRMIAREMVGPMVILFLLGGLQGGLGWIMVKSGLNDEDVRVSHIRLAIHFMAALSLLAFTLWFAFRLTVPVVHRLQHPALKSGWRVALVLLFFQLVYGAFMAGLHAGSYAPTWPDMNGQWIPGGMTDKGFGFFLTDNPFTVQFIHRGLGYLTAFFIIYMYFRSSDVEGTFKFRSVRKWPLILVVAQVALGILTVSYADVPAVLLWLGVAHQFVAMLLVMSVLQVYYLVSHGQTKAA